MTVRYLRQLLAKLDQTSVIDMAFDQEGIGSGDIDSQIFEGTLPDGRKVHTLLPIKPDDDFRP